MTSAGRRLETSRPDPTTLVVRRPVAAGERVTVSMPWRLRLSRRAGLALRGGRPARLVAFHPMLAWDGSGWATDGPLRQLASVWPTSPIADFDVRVTPPRGLRVLATGSEVTAGHWRARAVRSFAMAVGAFDVVRTVVRAPDPIAVVVGIEHGSLTPIQPFVDETRRSLRFYAHRYGGYPWPTYTVVVSGDHTSLAGTAFSTIGFVGDSSAVHWPLGKLGVPPYDKDADRAAWCADLAPVPNAYLSPSRASARTRETPRSTGRDLTSV